MLCLHIDFKVSQLNIEVLCMKFSRPYPLDCSTYIPIMIDTSLIIQWYNLMYIYKYIAP